MFLTIQFLVAVAANLTTAALVALASRIRRRIGPGQVA